MTSIRRIAIHTKYLGPTSHRGARIKAYTADERSITLSYPYHLSQEQRHCCVAQALLDQEGWTGKLTGGWTKEGAVFVFTSERGIGE